MSRVVKTITAVGKQPAINSRLIHSTKHNENLNKTSQRKLASFINFQYCQLSHDFITDGDREIVTVWWISSYHRQYEVDAVINTWYKYNRSGSADMYIVAVIVLVLVVIVVIKRYRRQYQTVSESIS